MDPFTPSQWWHPHSGQQKALKFMIQNKQCGLFLDPGLGKTSITLALIKYAKSVEAFTGCLVVAPLRVIYNVWSQERDKWINFHGISMVNLHALKKRDRVTAKADVLLINPEAIPAYIDQLGSRCPYSMLIVDESTKFKSPSSQRFKHLRKLIPKFKRRHILTGTPAPNSLVDLWSQMFILDLGRSLGFSMRQFEMDWLYRTDFKGYPERHVRPGLRPKFDATVAKLTVSMKASDYIDVPKLIQNEVSVDLSPRVKKIYKDLQNILFAQLKEDVKLTLFNASSLTTKLQQLTSGFLYVTEIDTDRRYEHVHDAKLDALKEIAEGTSEPILVACNYLGDVEVIRRHFKKTPYLGGGISATESTELINQWNRREIPLLCVHPKSVAHGINMQAGGNQIVWFGVTWSLEDYLQTNARLHRQGQVKPTIVHHIVANKTIDQTIVNRITNKEKRQLSVRESIEQYWRENSE